MTTQSDTVTLNRLSSFLVEQRRIQVGVMQVSRSSAVRNIAEGKRDLIDDITAQFMQKGDQDATEITPRA